jgi:twitching motility protein PilT
MPARYNDYVLTTAMEHGWISGDQHSLLLQALAQMPQVTALDLMHEQQMLTDDQVNALRGAIEQAESGYASPASDIDGMAEEHGSDAGLGPSRIGVPDGPANIVGHAEGFHHVDDYLRYAKSVGASDVHLGIDAPPLMRLHGQLRPLWDDAPIMERRHTSALVRGYLTDEQIRVLEQSRYLEFSYSSMHDGRYRSSVVRQRKGWDLVFRIINTDVRTMEELGLPSVLRTFIRYHNGLVLITGRVGSGKSTTLASMIEEINRERHDHIITLEDPIEYLFTPRGCQISQREVHTHTKSFAAALRGSLREDPDVIMVGEMRDLETISLAITASETGHLVLGTLHTANASRTLDRMLDAFPVEQQGQIRIMVAESLRGVVSQQLVPRLDGKGRALALEILVNIPAVAALIREAKTFRLPGVIQVGKRMGMRLMDDSLLELVKNGIISPEEGYDRAEQQELFTSYMKP